MMKDSWDNYVTHAWGENELRPLTHKGKRYICFRIYLKNNEKCIEYA